MNEIVKTAEYEVETAPDAGTLAALQGAEISQQIATARAFPRSIKAFHNQALELATLSEGVALECMYSVPRGGKKITGPSARLAEIIASCWGNCRYAARVVEEQRDFIVAQGVFHDLEKNSLVSFEVKRRITDSQGRRFNTDMIGVTGNAASSIALRNAVFKGVPKALWADVYEQAVATALGKNIPMEKRRAGAMEYFTKAGATQEQIFKALGVAAESEITMDDLVWLRGVQGALKSGEYTLESVFSDKGDKVPGRVLNMKTGKIEGGEEDPAPPKATKKPAAKKKPAPKKTPEPEPEAETETEAEAEAEDVETETDEEDGGEDDEVIEADADLIPEKPAVDLDTAMADPEAWADIYIAYYESLRPEAEEAFILETDYIVKQFRKDFRLTHYQKISSAIASK